MLLAIEIALTIAAWRKGWKGLALLPVGAALVCGFMVGAAMGAGGLSEEEVFGIGLLIDLGVIAALGVMTAVGRRTATSTGQQSTSASPEAASPAVFPSTAAPADAAREPASAGRASHGVPEHLAGTVQ